MTSESTMICSKCGASLEADDASSARFCPGCGASFGPGASIGMKLVAAGSVLLGVLVLVGATWRGLASESGETKLLRADVLGLEKKAAGRQEDLEALGKEQVRLEAEYRKQKELLKKKEEELSSCEGEIARLEAANREEVDRASKRLEAVRKQLADSKAVADQILRKEVDKARRKERRIRLMERYRHLCVTLWNSAEEVSSGFLYDAGRSAYIVTSDRIAARGKTVYAKIMFRRGSKYYVMKRSSCRLVRRDVKRGLAFYSPTLPRGATVTCASSRMASGAKAGDEVFVIATNVVGGKVLDYTVHDGTVSAADRKVDGLSYVQTTLPCNPGCAGAPVIDSDGKLIAVLMKALGNLEKSSLAISVDEVAKSLRGR